MNRGVRGAIGLVLIASVLGCGRSTPGEGDASDRAGGSAWAQWRGPGGLGVSSDDALPLHWSAESDNVRWRIALDGKGNSSPIVAGGRVILTAVQRADAQRLDRVVQAYDLETGAQQFSTVVFSDKDYDTHLRNTNAAPTPVTDGERIYAFFGSQLAALDTDGVLVWVEEVDPLYSQFAHYGAASSPVLFDDLVILFQDTEEARSGKKGWLGAFRAATGEQVWRKEWEDSCCSYTTPVLWPRDGGVDLVVSHSGKVEAYDPATGEPRWAREYDVNQSVASPVFDGDLLCTLGGAHNVRGSGCFRSSGSGAAAAVEPLWWDREAVPEDASPVLYEGKLYSVTIQGVMSCYDPTTGAVLWRTRLPTRQHHSSLVAGDGKVYAYSSWGRTVVVNARAEQFEMLADNGLKGRGGNASPALADGCVVIRTLDELFRICGEPSTPVPPVTGRGDDDQEADLTGDSPSAPTAR